MTALLEGRVVVVTGAGRGIGRGIARRLARERATVVVADLDGDSGEAVCQEIEDDLGGAAHPRRTDVADEADARELIEETVARFGRVDALVNNAQGFSPLARLEDKTTAMYDFSLRTGFYGTLWTMQAAHGHMKDQGGGSIVNLGSLNGISGAVLLSDYNVTKEAIRGLTRSAAREWGHHGIRVNAVLPLALTPAHIAFEAEQPEFARRLRDTLPLGRVGDPEDDIGSAVLFLVSDYSCYVTGTSMFVDGGLHLSPLGVADIRSWDPPADTPQWPPSGEPT